MLALEPRRRLRRAWRCASPPTQVQSELGVLWNREMLTGAYLPRWVRLTTRRGPGHRGHLRREPRAPPLHGPAATGTRGAAPRPRPRSARANVASISSRPWPSSPGTARATARCTRCCAPSAPFRRVEWPHAGSGSGSGSRRAGSRSRPSRRRPRSAAHPASPAARRCRIRRRCSRAPTGRRSSPARCSTRISAATRAGRSPVAGQGGASLVHRPPREVWAVLTDFERWPEFMPLVNETHVERREGANAVGRAELQRAVVPAAPHHGVRARSAPTAG